MNYTLFRSVRTLLFCLILNSLHGQSTVISDSLLTKNPLWSGDTAWMNFTSEGLRTNAPGAGSLHWSLPSTAAINAQWRLNITLDFNPSSSNFCEVQFIDGPKGQYVLQLSGNSSDALSLILRRPGQNDSALASLPDYLNQSSPTLSLRLIRDSTYTFRVYDDQNLLLSATDSTLRNSRRFTLYCKYTASRVDKFLFSTLHLEGRAFQDTLPPRLISIAQESPRAIRLTFNEACVPAPGALNGLIAYHQGTAIDTALYPELDGRNWTCTFPKPLPRAALAFLLQNAVDTAQNPSGNLWEFLDIDYLPERCMAITAIQPFDQRLPSFLRIQSHHSTPATLHWRSLSGTERSYAITIDSGLTTLHLDLPTAGAIWIEHQQILLAHHTFDDGFNPAQRQGYHMLQCDSLSFGRRHWSVVPSSTDPNWLQPSTFTPYPDQLFAESDGTLWLQWSDNAYTLVPRPHSWHPAQPYLTSTSPWPSGQTWPWSFPPTTIASLPDSGHILLNEIHFAPDDLDEFIEIANLTDRPIATADLWLQLWDGPNLLRAAPLDTRPLRLRHDGLSPVLLPNEILALPAPFTLPNDSLTLELITAPGQILDRMTYFPLEAPHDHQSFERISWHSPGHLQANWHPHLPSPLASTEASPNQPNSVAGALPTLPLEASIVPNFIDLGPNSMAGVSTGSGASNGSSSGAGSGAGSGSSAGSDSGATGTGPHATLWLHAERGDRLYVSLLDRTGRLLHPLVDGQELPAAKKGAIPFVLAPQSWGEGRLQSGIYWVQCQLEGPRGTRKKILPLSIYNP